MAASTQKRKSDKARQRGESRLILFHENNATGWVPLRPIAAAAGEARVSLGTARRVYLAETCTGEVRPTLTGERKQLVGYQFQAPPKDSKVESVPSSCVISRMEMELIAGQTFARGGSRTALLTEEQRKRRIVRGRYAPEEDGVERAVEKLRCWTGPVLGTTPDRATRVYPKG